MQVLNPAPPHTILYTFPICDALYNGNTYNGSSLASTPPGAWAAGGRIYNMTQVRGWEIGDGARPMKGSVNKGYQLTATLNGGGGREHQQLFYNGSKRRDGAREEEEGGIVGEGGLGALLGSIQRSFGWAAQTSRWSLKNASQLCHL